MTGRVDFCGHIANVQRRSRTTLFSGKPDRAMQHLAKVAAVACFFTMGAGCGSSSPPPSVPSTAGEPAASASAAHAQAPSANAKPSDVEADSDGTQPKPLPAGVAGDK